MYGSKSMIRVPSAHKAHSTHWRTGDGRVHPVTVRQAKFSDAYSRGKLESVGSRYLASEY